MLKCNPLRWLWGLLPLILIGWVALLGMQQRIEADLEQRTREHLDRNNLQWANVAFKGRDALLTGRAEEESDQRRPAIEMAKIWGVRSIEDRVEVLQLIRNYMWSARTGDGQLTLTGYVPNAAARKAVLASARSALPKYKVEDRLEYARGAPDQKVWLTGTAFALRQLAALKPGGSVTMEGASLSAVGEAESSKAYETVRSQLNRSMPQGISLKADRVVPPVVKPYTWAAALRGRQVELSGHAPSIAARDQIKAAAEKSLSGRTVVDRMTLASGSPGDWQRVATLALGQLSALRQGNAEILDSRLSVTGYTDTEDGAAAVRRALTSGMPRGFQLTQNIQQDPAEKAAEEARRAAEARRLAEEAARAEAARRAAEEAARTEAQRRAAEEAARVEAARRAAEEAARADAIRREAEEMARQDAERKAAEARKAAEDAARADAARRAAEAAAKRAAEQQRIEAEKQTKAAAAAEAARKARLAEAQRCEQSMAQSVASGIITFKRASAELDRNSHKTLNTIAQIIKSCPGFEIEIGGHTDNEGEPDRNQRLSERRANSVLDYLVKVGTPKSALKATGFGQAKPKVPNDTPANMALNRRIEFTVTAR
jgi:OOP family OmpA-OmpF porin